MKTQQCEVLTIYGRIALALGVLAFLIVRRAYWFAGIFAVSWLALRWIYGRWVFPKVARFLGYGSVADETAAHPGRSAVKVTFYTASGCPFCPLVERRLEALRAQMGFTLERIDVTLRPRLITSKGVSAVPFVEVGRRRLIGNATSLQLAELIALPA